MSQAPAPARNNPSAGSHPSPRHDPCRVVVLISGNGSNLQAIIDHSERGGYQVVAVFSNREDAFGLQRAASAGIAAHTLNHKDHASREAFDGKLMQAIDACQPDLVVLAGFMRILTPAFVQHYAARLLNIHPSLLPAYKGTNTHQRVLDAGDSHHGASVHFVTEELDGGPVVGQARITVNPDDTADTLAQRVAKEEHTLYPQVITWFASGRLVAHQDGVLLDGKPLPAQDFSSSAAI